MKATSIVFLAALPAVTLAGGLPRVAPPGPGMSSTPPGGSVEELYRRRLDAADGPAPAGPRAPAPAVLYPTPSGAVTDTGTPLNGRAGVLRDPGGGVWTCTGTGCFSPGGTFLPMKKAPPAAPAQE